MRITGLTMSSQVWRARNICTSPINQRNVAYELDFALPLVDDNPWGVFEPLRDIERFCNVEAEYALIWPDPVTGDALHAVDLAPECVCFFCQRHGQVVDNTAVAVVV